MNRRTRRALGVERNNFASWVKALPDAPVRRRDLPPIMNAMFDAAFKEYHERYSPARVVARLLGYVIGVVIWPVRTVVQKLRGAK